MSGGVSCHGSRGLGTSLLQLFDTFLLDCDGVLWIQDSPIKGAEAAIRELRSHNKRVLFVSNNCEKTVPQFQDKFRNLLKIDDIPSRDIINSAVSTAIYLKHKMDLQNEKVFTIAQDSFTETLESHGIKSFGPGFQEPLAFADWKDFEVDPAVKYVVASYDPHFNHTKLTQAYLYLTQNNAEFISPDVDKFFTVSPGRKIPGSFCVQAAISSVLPHTRQPRVMGKPSEFLFELIEREHGKLDRLRTVMIGDNYQTDMMFGYNCGIGTALVLTGNVKEGEVGELERRPDFVLDSIDDIVSS